MEEVGSLVLNVESEADISGLGLVTILGDGLGEGSNFNSGPVHNNEDFNPNRKKEKKNNLSIKKKIKKGWRFGQKLGLASTVSDKEMASVFGRGDAEVGRIGEEGEMGR